MACCGGSLRVFDGLCGPHHARRKIYFESMYFVSEFYGQLAKRLPRGTVILQATSIDQNNKGQLYLRSDGTLPPAVLYVDFFTYFAPLRSYVGLPETAGKFVTPLISVYTSYKGSPETFGAVAGVKVTPLTTGGTEPNSGVANGLGGNLLTFFNNVPGSNGGSTPKPKKVLSGPPYKGGHYFQFPIIEFAMEVDEIKAQASQPGGFYDTPPSHKIFGAYADIIVEALNELDHKSAIEVDRRSYARMYDSALAKKSATGNLSENEFRRMKYIERFEAEEHRFLTVNDREFIGRTYKSNFGDQVRAMMVAEEDLRGKTNRAAATMIVSGMAAAAVGTRTGYMDMSYWQIFQRTLENLTHSFNRHFGKVNEESFGYVIQVGEEKISIRTNELDELRKITRKIYRTKILPLYPSRGLS